MVCLPGRHFYAKFKELFLQMVLGLPPTTLKAFREINPEEEASLSGAL